MIPQTHAFFFYNLITHDNTMSDNPKRTPNKFSTVIAAAKARREELDALRNEQLLSGRTRPDERAPGSNGQPSVRLEVDEDERARNEKVIKLAGDMIAMIDKRPLISSDVIINTFPDQYLNYKSIDCLREQVITGERTPGAFPSGMSLVEYYDCLYDKEEIDRDFYMKNDLPPARYLPEDHDLFTGLIDLVTWKLEVEKAGGTPDFDEARRMFSSAFGPGFGEEPGALAKKAWDNPDLNMRPIQQLVRTAQMDDISEYRKMWASNGIQWWYVGQRDQLIRMIEESNRRPAKN